MQCSDYHHDMLMLLGFVNYDSLCNALECSAGTISGHACCVLACLYIMIHVWCVVQLFLAMPTDCPVAPDGSKRNVPSGADERNSVSLYTSEDNAQTFKQVHQNHPCCTSWFTVVTQSWRNASAGQLYSLFGAVLIFIGKHTGHAYISAYLHAQPWVLAGLQPSMCCLSPIL